MQRIPAVPYFQPITQVCDPLVTQDLEALYPKNKEQQLGRDRPADHEPVLFRQRRENAAPSQFLRVHVIFTPACLERQYDLIPRVLREAI